MATSPTAMVYSREFHTDGEALALPASSVTSFQDLVSILFKIHKQDSTTHEVHVHLDDLACNGIISDLTWDAGVYFAPTQERLDIFPHFVEKGIPYLTYATPTSKALSVFSDVSFKTPMRNGLHKGPSRLAVTVPKLTATSSRGASQRLASSVPRGQSIRTVRETQQSHFAANGEATQSLREDSADTSFENDIDNCNATVKGELAHAGTDPETPIASGIASGAAHTPGPLPKEEAADLDPSLMVNVTYTYYQGTAGVFRNFRVTSLALPLATEVTEIREEITNAITHSINSSSRLRIYRSQVEYDIFVSANQPGAVNHGLHEATTLGAHMIALGAAGGLLVNTYIYLAHEGVRYDDINDALPDAEHARVIKQAKLLAVKIAAAKKKGKMLGAEPTGAEDEEPEAVDEDSVAVNSDEDSSSFAPRRKNLPRAASQRKRKALAPRSPSVTPDPPARPAKRRRVARSPTPDLDDLIRDNGILVGQAMRSMHSDGRRNAVIAIMSPHNRILFQCIDEDINGVSLSIRGVARIMPEEIDYHREYRKMGRDQRRTEIKRKIEEAFGA